MQLRSRRHGHVALLATPLVVVLFALALTACSAAGDAGAPGAPTRAAGGGGDAGNPLPSASPSASPASSPVDASDPIPALGAERIAEFANPVYLTAPPLDDRRLLVVEREGRIRVLRDGAVLEPPFLDISDHVLAGGERGLLSMAFDPEYAQNRRFYVYYTARDGSLTIARYRTGDDPERADPTSGTVLLSIPHPVSNHNGGQLQFGPDGLLYVGTGDGGGAGDPERDALNPQSRLGKLLTLNVNEPAPRPSVYALGLRNPWRFSFDRQTGDLWIGDVGQNEREEIDFLPAGTPPGTNFGWNEYEGTLEFSRSGLDRDSLTFPVFEYGRDQGGSVVGGYVYRGKDIPALRGAYLFTDFFGSGFIWVARGPEGKPQRVSLDVSQIASFGEDAAGEVYAVSLAGPVYRIVSR